MIAAALLATAAPLTVPLDAACVIGTDPAAEVLRERLQERGAVCALPSSRRKPGSMDGETPAKESKASDTMDSGLRRNDGVGEGMVVPAPCRTPAEAGVQWRAARAMR